MEVVEFGILESETNSLTIEKLAKPENTQHKQELRTLRKDLRDAESAAKQAAAAAATATPSSAAAAASSTAGAIVDGSGGGMADIRTAERIDSLQRQIQTLKVEVKTSKSR